MSACSAGWAGKRTWCKGLLAGLADNAALYGGLHALDGILILAIAGFLYAMSRR